ncbi:MAG: ABC transporter ATP-binding protein [Thermoplasmataceae archaeon]
MPDPIVVSELSKSYVNGSRSTVALNSFSFRGNRNMILSLLGRNGSGKTTFAKIATTQLMPDSGDVYLNGTSVIDEPEEIRATISLVPQEGRPFGHLTPREHVYYYQRMIGETREKASTVTDMIIEELDIESFQNTQCVNLSGGQKQTTMLAMALSKDAETYFLDEPTIGLDVITRKRVWEVIERLRRERKMVILTTHYLDEASVLSDEICIVSHGRLVSQGTLNDLRSRLGHDTRIRFSTRVDEKVVSSMGTLVDDEKGQILLTESGNVEEVLKTVGYMNGRIEIGPVGLDDVFVSMVGEDIDE